MTSDQIKDRNVTSLTDTLLYTPGVVAQSGVFSRMADDLMMRGFDVADGSSGMLRDGMQFQSNVYGGGQEPYGLERVEVLRGPASILYGQMSPGGVVNAISKRPTQETLREVNLEYRTYDYKQISADLGGKSRIDSSYGVTSANSLEASFDALGAEHTVMLGFDYCLRSYDSHRYRGSSYSLLDLDTGVSRSCANVNYAVDRGSDTLANQYGLFAQDQIKFGEHWVLLLGGRQDWANSTTTSYQTGATTEEDDNAFTGRAGLVYLFDAGIAPFASVSQSFQPQAGLNYATGEALDPSKGLQYEACIRYQPAGQNLLLSAAVQQF